MASLRSGWRSNFRRKLICDRLMFTCQANIRWTKNTPLNLLVFRGVFLSFYQMHTENKANIHFSVSSDFFFGFIPQNTAFIRITMSKTADKAAQKPMSIPQKDVLPNKSIHSLDQVIQIPPIIKVIRRSGVRRLFSGWLPAPYKAGYRESGRQSRRRARRQIQVQRRRA